MGLGARHGTRGTAYPEGRPARAIAGRSIQAYKTM